MKHHGKNSCHVYVHKGDWLKNLRINIYLKYLLFAAIFIMPSQSWASDKAAQQGGEKAALIEPSSGKALLCTPPQTSRMDGCSNAIANPGTQRNAGKPSLSYAMALSMALGLRNVAGPVDHRNAAHGRGL
jgi:hypothetical protein